MAYGYLVFLLAAVLSAQAAEGASVCVAVVNNHTTKSLDPERMTGRLVRSITEKNKVIAIAMESSTGDAKQLRPTLENSAEVKRRECDYLLLTQVSDPQNDPTVLRSPEISIGGRVPSTDASDPMAGQSGPAYRDNLQINFAVFRAGNLKPALDTYLLDRPSATVADSLMQAMDREGNRVSKELGKKDAARKTPD